MSDSPTAVRKQLSHFFEPALLTELLTAGRQHSFQPGDVLAEPGQPMRYIPIVLTGSIKIMRSDGDSEVLLYYLRPADSCALSISSLLSGEPTVIRAIVDEPAQVLLIPLEQANDWLGRYAGWRQFIVRTYQKRFDDLLQSFDAVAFRHLDERLMAYLDQRATINQGRHLYLTHDDIARDLNTSREVISRLLKQLERLGRVSLSRNKISLLKEM